MIPLQLGLHRVQIVGALDVAAGGQILRLGAHVLNLGQLQGAVLLSLGEGSAGNVGVDVDLEAVVVLADDQTVADAVQIGLKGLQPLVGRGFADNEHGVEGEGDLLRGNGRVVGLALHLRLPLAVPLGHGHAPQGVQHALEDHQEALAAGVHHTGLLQDGVHLGGVLQGELPLGDGGLQHGLRVVGGLAGCVGGPGRRQAGDGEDGALGGLHHRLVGGGHAEVQGDGQIATVDAVLVLDRLGKAAEEQGQNDAGVAPGAPQQGGGVGGGGLAHGVGLLLAQLRRGGAEGQAHVGAGVPVGHGEDVQFVDLLLLQIEGGRRVNHGLGKRRSVNALSHIGCSFLSMGAGRFSR